MPPPSSDSTPRAASSPAPPSTSPLIHNIDKTLRNNINITVKTLTKQLDRNPQDLVKTIPSIRGLVLKFVKFLDDVCDEDKLNISLPSKIVPVTTVEHQSVQTLPDDTPSNPSPTYASVAAQALAPADKPVPSSDMDLDIPTPRPITSTLPNSRPQGQARTIALKNPVRLVVRPTQTRYMQKPFAMLLVAGPSEPFRVLSHTLSLSPLAKDVTLLGVHTNRSGNLIVSLPHGTSEANVDTVISIIHRAYTPILHFPLLVTRDVAWAKFMVSSVKARPEPGMPTSLEEEVKASFLLNPSVQDLKITREPRWVRNPASITGAHSSFTFSFQDPDGSIGRVLVKSRLYVFGEPVHLKRWIDKPRQIRGSEA
ncbi:hypothetical protein FRC07_014477, partial [Ceratobasidium sp. 392]